MIQMLADACVARRNATSWLQARLCVMSSYMRDYAQRVRECADVVVKTPKSSTPPLSRMYPFSPQPIQHFTPGQETDRHRMSMPKTAQESISCLLCSGIRGVCVAYN